MNRGSRRCSCVYAKMKSMAAFGLFPLILFKLIRKLSMLVSSEPFQASGPQKTDCIVTFEKCYCSWLFICNIGVKLLGMCSYGNMALYTTQNKFDITDFTNRDVNTMRFYFIKVRFINGMKSSLKLFQSYGILWLSEKYSFHVSIFLCRY